MLSTEKSITHYKNNPIFDQFVILNTDIYSQQEYRTYYGIPFRAVPFDVILFSQQLFREAFLWLLCKYSITQLLDLSV